MILHSHNTFLLSRGIAAIILRLLLHLYTSQKVFVKWQNSISSCYYVQNGVPQGVIISSLLLSLYIDVLLISHLKDRRGCSSKSITKRTTKTREGFLRKT